MVNRKQSGKLVCILRVVATDGYGFVIVIVVLLAANDVQCTYYRILQILISRNIYIYVFFFKLNFAASLVERSHKARGVIQPRWSGQLPVARNTQSEQPTRRSDACDVNRLTDRCNLADIKEEDESR